METHWNLVKIAEQGDAMITRTTVALRDSGRKELATLADKLPETMADDGEPIRVVFAGQYGSGKSSAMRVLTGRKEIQVGDGIVTTAATPYRWHGLELIDTPGVWASRPDHDEITLEAITKADLIAYFTTNELMDSCVADGFRKLVLEAGKGEVLLVVVNKMDRHQDRNSEEAQAIVRDALAPVIQPRTWDDTPLVCLSVRSAERAEQEADPELRELDRAESGMAALVAALNRFAEERGLIGRQARPLFALEQVLAEAEALFSTGSNEADELRRLWTRERREIVNAKRKVERSAREEGAKLASFVRRKGSEASALLNPGVDPGVTESKIREIAEQASLEVSRAHDRLRDQVTSIVTELDRDIDALYMEPASVVLGDRLAELAAGVAGQGGGLGDAIAKKGPAAAGDVGQWLLKQAKAPGARSLKGLRALKGSNLHSAIGKIGHFFGKKFRPWEALKYAKALKVAGKVLAIAGALLPPLIQAWESWQEDKAAKRLLTAKAELRNEFNTVASAMREEFARAVDDLARDLLSTAELDEKLSDLAQRTTARDEGQDTVRQLLVEARTLKTRLLESQAASLHPLAS